MIFYKTESLKKQNPRPRVTRGPEMEMPNDCEKPKEK